MTGSTQIRTANEEVTRPQRTRSASGGSERRRCFVHFPLYHPQRIFSDELRRARRTPHLPSRLYFGHGAGGIAKHEERYQNWPRVHKSPAQFLHSENPWNYSLLNHRFTKSISLAQDDRSLVMERFAPMVGVCLPSVNTGCGLLTACAKVRNRQRHSAGAKAPLQVSGLRHGSRRAP
jgi:hypothetical protein